MRIVHLIWQFQVGGAETMLVDIVNEQSLTEEVLLIVGNAMIDHALLSQLNSRVKVKLLGRPQGNRNPWYLIKLYRTIVKFRPNIIHAHFESFIRILKFIRKPRVMTIHNTGISLTARAHQYDAIFCVSASVKHDIKQRYPSLITYIVNNGINFSSIQKKSHYGDSPFRIVQVSRLDHHQKGQDVLLHAVNKVNETLKGKKKIMLDFIGDGLSQSYLQNLSKSLGMEGYCKFLGVRSRSYIYDVLQSYDLLVQPSRYEGFGLTVLEGMAAGLPVLVSDIEGPMEIIDSGRYGYHFRSEDATDCAQQILQIMKLSISPKFPSERKAAEQYVRARYSIPITAKQYLTEYAKVIASRTLSIY